MSKQLKPSAWWEGPSHATMADNDLLELAMQFRVRVNHGGTQADALKSATEELQRRLALCRSVTDESSEEREREMEALLKIAAEAPTRITSGEWDGVMVGELIRAALTRGHPWLLRAVQPMGDEK